MVRSGVGAAPVVEPVPTGGRTAAGAAGGCRGGASGAGREGRVGSVEGRKSRGTGRPPAGSGGVLGEPRSLPAGSSVADRSPPVRAETGEGMAFRRRAAGGRALVAPRNAREAWRSAGPAAGRRVFGAPRSGVPGRDRVVPPDRRSGERSLLAGCPRGRGVPPPGGRGAERFARRRGTLPGAEFHRRAAGRRGFGASRSGIRRGDGVLPPARRSGSARCSPGGLRGRGVPPPGGRGAERLARRRGTLPGAEFHRRAAGRRGFGASRSGIRRGDGVLPPDRRSGSACCSPGGLRGRGVPPPGGWALSASLVGAEPCRGRSSTGGLPVVEGSALPEAESGEGMVFFRRIVGRGALVARRVPARAGVPPPGGRGAERSSLVRAEPRRVGSSPPGCRSPECSMLVEAESRGPEPVPPSGRRSPRSWRLRGRFPRRECSSRRRVVDR